MAVQRPFFVQSNGNNHRKQKMMIPVTKTTNQNSPFINNAAIKIFVMLQQAFDPDGDLSHTRKSLLV